jgi:hypothetical protein
MLPMLASGRLNKQVAFELGITEYTNYIADTLCKNGSGLFRKLGQNVGQAQQQSPSAHTGAIREPSFLTLSRR